MSTRTTIASPPPRRRRVKGALRKGAEFEREIARRLAARGWFVVRSGGSRSPADLVAIPPRHYTSIETRSVWLIQAKAHNRSLPKREARELLSLVARHAGVVTVHAKPAEAAGSIELVDLASSERYELPTTTDEGRPLRLLADARVQR